MNLKNILKEIGISLKDSTTQLEFDGEVVELLEKFIEKKIDLKELRSAVDAKRFILSIDEYIIENKNQERFDIYSQHKKIINSDKRKFIEFLKRFGFINEEDFKKKLYAWEKENSYPEEFYDEKTRKILIEKQSYNCPMCNRDLRSFLPHLHHIDYNKKNCEQGNMIFLCPRCHGKTNTNREFWSKLLGSKKILF